MTDFLEWTKEEIIAYLDRKGEDHADCQTLDAIVQRARECQVNCGEAAQKVEAETVQEEDALDAFMKGIDDGVFQEACGKKRANKGEVMASEDPGIEFLEEQHRVTQETTVDHNDRFERLSQFVSNLNRNEESYMPFKKNIIGQAPPVMKDFETIFGADRNLMKALQEAGYSKPTSIQSKAIPEILMGKDLIGIAATGSGKTLAFVLPLVVHVEAQQRPADGEGPLAVILAPTRELAEQIHRETRKFGTKTHKLKSCAAFGGLDKYTQIKELKNTGVDIAVATPGRLLDLIKSRACTLKRVTYLVIDEVDMMFHLGFEHQLKAIISQIRPDRQVVMFSATMPKKVQALANECLKNPARILIRDNTKLNIKQSVHVTNTTEEKKSWLLNRIEHFIDQGNVIIFANHKTTVEDLYDFLNSKVSRLGMIHGDMDQATRMKTIADFKAGKMHVLAATDIAARGLDIEKIQIVINFDMPKDIHQYIHRIGRTSRGDNKDGEAFSLLLPNEHREAAFVVRYLNECGIQVPQYVSNVANRIKRRSEHVWNADFEKTGGQGRREKEKNMNSGTMAGFVGAASSGPVAGRMSVSQVAILPPRNQEKNEVKQNKKRRWDT